jgi:hypothetical protein
MVSGDYYVTMYKSNDLNEIPMRVHLWLEGFRMVSTGKPQPTAAGLGKENRIATSNCGN